MTKELIETENLLLISNQKNARLLRKQRKENEINQNIFNKIQQVRKQQTFSLFFHSFSLKENQIILTSFSIFFFSFFFNK